MLGVMKQGRSLPMDEVMTYVRKLDLRQPALVLYPDGKVVILECNNGWDHSEVVEHYNGVTELLEHIRK